jgi:hypothetical protein
MTDVGRMSLQELLGKVLADEHADVLRQAAIWLAPTAAQTPLRGARSANRRQRASRAAVAAAVGALPQLVGQQAVGQGGHERGSSITRPTHRLAQAPECPPSRRLRRSAAPSPAGQSLYISNQGRNLDGCSSHRGHGVMRGRPALPAGGQWVRRRASRGGA